MKQLDDASRVEFFKSLGEFKLGNNIHTMHIEKLLNPVTHKKENFTCVYEVTDKLLGEDHHVFIGNDDYETFVNLQELGVIPPTTELSAMEDYVSDYVKENGFTLKGEFSEEKKELFVPDPFCGLSEITIDDELIPWFFIAERCLTKDDIVTKTENGVIGFSLKKDDEFIYKYAMHAFVPADKIDIVVKYINNKLSKAA